MAKQWVGALATLPPDTRTRTREEASLSAGELSGTGVHCPLHGSLFDVRTGAVKGLPVMIPATAFPVSVERNGVYVEA